MNEVNIERRKKVPKLVQNKFYHEADQRVKSCLFFAVVIQGKKRFLQSFPQTILSDINSKEFFAQCEAFFKKEKNFIVERMHLYNSNQADKKHATQQLLQKQMGNNSNSNYSNQNSNYPNQGQTGTHTISSEKELTKQNKPCQKLEYFGKPNKPTNNQKACYFYGNNFSPNHKSSC